MFAGAAEEPANARAGGDVIKAEIVQESFFPPRRCDWRACA